MSIGYLVISRIGFLIAVDDEIKLRYRYEICRHPIGMENKAALAEWHRRDRENQVARYMQKTADFADTYFKDVPIVYVGGDNYMQLVPFSDELYPRLRPITINSMRPYTNQEDGLATLRAKAQTDAT